MPNGFGPDRPKLIKALREAVPTQDDLEQLTRDYLGERLADITAGGIYRKQISDLVDWAEVRSRERELIDAALEYNEDNKELRAVAASVRAYLQSTQPWYTSPNPLDTCMVRNDRAFVDRDGLRQSMQQMMVPQGPRALMVNGEPRSGRTYSLQLIVYVKDQSSSYRVIDIDLCETGSDPGPLGLMRRIALQMRRDTNTIPPKQTQVARWNMELRDWLIAETDASPDVWWLVIDGIDQVGLGEDTLDLIRKIVRAIVVRAANLRVVVLAWSEPLPNDLRHDVIQEVVEPIERDAIEAYFARFFQHLNVPVEAGAIDEAVKGALALAGPNGDDHLERLSLAVAKVAKELAAPP